MDKTHLSPVAQDAQVLAHRWSFVCAWLFESSTIPCKPTSQLCSVHNLVVFSGALKAHGAQVTLSPRWWYHWAGWWVARVPMWKDRSLSQKALWELKGCTHSVFQKANLLENLSCSNFKYELEVHVQGVGSWRLNEDPTVDWAFCPLGIILV